MCVGVVVILAMLKFSGSPKYSGLNEIRVLNSRIINVIGKISLTIKIGKNFIFSKFVAVPVGFEDPDSCRRIRWIKASTTTTRGTIKCRENIRFKVGCETEKSPHNHMINGSPTYGNDDNILVITVAPQ